MSKSKLPSFSQWKQIFKVLKKGEKITFSVFFLLGLGSLIFLVSDIYIRNTKPVPANGGMYVEGVVGQPRFINPIYGETDDIDRTLIGLVFSGLMTYDKDGNIVGDLAESYTVSPDGKTYTFQIRKNAKWHDKKPVTADDVVFTIKTIQNSDYKSPLRANWIDVQIEKKTDKSVAFTLRTPYNSFLENCTLKIIPKHVWEDIVPESFALSAYNLQPIGSGAYVFENIDQTGSGFIKKIDLKSNKIFYRKAPYISNLSFEFFESNDDLVKAANAKTIDGFSLASFDNNEAAAEKKINQGWSAAEKFSPYSFSLPRYFAVFFNNQKAKLLSDANIRKALVYSVNKSEFVQKISEDTKSKILPVESPILSDFFGFNKPEAAPAFDVSKAEELLDKSGYKKNSLGKREKALDKKPAFQFTTYLKQGSKGTEVTQLQACLNKLDSSYTALMEGETNGTYGKGTDTAVMEFQKKYMPSENPTGEVGKATREKLNELCLAPSENTQLLKISLTTVNQPQTVKAANLLKEYWEAAGITVEINAIDVSELKTLIKSRNYEALLYGEALGTLPDLYPFWHSSQVNDPGLNLCSYMNKDVDALLKDARENVDKLKIAENYEKIQDILISEAPALFLYNPDYMYWVSENVKGLETTKIVDPAKRFINVENWYLQTKRVWK